jgi:hypothetical protein
VRSVPFHDLGGAFRTTHIGVAAHAEEAQRRAEIRAAARANLAAVLCEEYGINATEAGHSSAALRRAAAAFAELAAVLGLSVDAAGSLDSGARGATWPSMEAGIEGWSWPPGADTDPPPQPVAAGRNPQRWAYPGPAGRCPACDRSYQLTRQGRLRIHRAWKVDPAGVRYRSAQDCPASGREPVD